MIEERLGRVLAPDYLDDLPSRPIEGIRTLRAECLDIETGLSYLRRVLQARIDIVGTHLRNQAEGGREDLGSLIDQLPKILSERGTRTTAGRLPSLLAPSGDVDTALTQRIDDVVSPGQLSSLTDLPLSEVEAMAQKLTEMERTVSAERRALHDRIDALQAELTRRYKSGEANVESLLT